jgi:hypothetical protein
MGLMIDLCYFILIAYYVVKELFDTSIKIQDKAILKENKTLDSLFIQPKAMITVSNAMFFRSSNP